MADVVSKAVEFEHLRTDSKNMCFNNLYEAIDVNETPTL